MKAILRLRLNVWLVLGALLALALITVLVLPSVVKLTDPDAQRMAAEVGGKMKPAPFRPGEAGFPLGSDQAGRDMLSRLVYGARQTVSLALLITLARAAFAIPLGLAAGWRNGWAARLLAGLGMGFSAVPTLVLVIFALQSLQAVSGSSWRLVYVATLLIVGVPRLADQVRRLTEEAAGRPHLEAAVAVGAGRLRILGRHVLPLLRSDLLVILAAEMAWVLMLIGQIAIFGLLLGGMVAIPRDGFPPIIVERTIEWGQMLGVNRSVARDYPWIALYPALALGLTVACFQLLAEGLRLRWAQR
jgi:peptide/nickel transport system permease protein